MDADSCELGVERFKAQGQTEDNLVDNFVGAEKELLGRLKSTDQHRIKSKMSQNGLLWKFNYLATPHQGRAW